MGWDGNRLCAYDRIYIPLMLRSDCLYRFLGVSHRKREVLLAGPLRAGIGEWPKSLKVKTDEIESSAVRYRQEGLTRLWWSVVMRNLMMDKHRKGGT
jgi:hypothetical protein